jgi:hypothetical protein
MRSSGRIRAQPNATDTQLERAMKIAQDREPGSISRFSIDCFDDSLIQSIASTLGVPLGSTPTEVASSVKFIKDLDLHRTMIMLKKNMDTKTDDDTSSSFILDKAAVLSADLQEEEQQGSEDQKDPTPPQPKITRVYKRRTAVRFSARLKNKKLAQ